MSSSAANVVPDSLPLENDRHIGEHSASAWRRTRLQIGGIVIIGALVIALLWLIVFMMIDIERRAAMDDARGDANNLSAAFLGEVTGKLDSISSAMDLVASRMRADPNFDLITWARENRQLTAAAMHSAAIISPDGWLVSGTMMSIPKPFNMRDRDYFRAQVEGTHTGTFISPVGVGRLTGEFNLRVSRRVESDDGRLLGVLVFSVAPNQITGLPASADLGRGGLLALVGSDNVIRARFTAVSPNGEQGAGRRVKGPPSNSGEPVQSYIRMSELDGVTRLFSARDVPGYPLYVSVAYDLDQVLRPAAFHARLSVSIGIIATLMLSGLITLLTIQIRRCTDREVTLREEQARLAAEIRHGGLVQSQLRCSETRLRDIAKVASDWFWEQDADLRFVSVGIEAPEGTENLGRRRWEINDTSQAPEHWANHQRDLAAREPFRDFRFSRIAPDGKPRHLSVSGVPAYDDAGEFIGYRGTGRDITEQVEAEAELRAAKDRAEQAETLLRDAVESMSEGFVIYDREDRLVMCNQQFRDAYGKNADILVRGATFRDLAMSAQARGEFADASGRQAEWLRERERQFRECTGSFERLHSNGRWILVTDRRMRNGGLAGLRVDITALKQTQAALRESEARLERAQEIAGIGSWELDIADGRYIWSRQMYRMRALSPDSFVPTRAAVAGALQPEDLPSLSGWLNDLMAGHPRDPVEIRINRSDIGERVLLVEGRPVVDPDGDIRRLAGTMQDITERRLLERQLMQAQKMEAIGHLTGGMAHDFNNGLGVIIGNLDLLGRLVQGNSDAAELCSEAHSGAVRCADLVRQLLAFARQQPLRPRQTDVNLLVDETIRMLGRTLGQQITLHADLGAAVWPAMADPVQLEAALINLATNARDAMPKGGRLDIMTRNVELDARYAEQYPEVTPGAFVLIEVSDTGTGILPAIIGQVFEPFFTTKGPGQGSGLGLSMVFGFVKQSGGHLTVCSEPGRGSTFRIYLPRALVEDTQVAAPAGRSPVGGGHETVLVVEDNEPLRQVTVRRLADLGYRVLEAADAVEALVVLDTSEPIDLLFTDVVMPGTMDGIDLAERAAKVRPGLRVLLTSGFPAGRGHGHRSGVSEYRLLGKPYHEDELARAIRAVLNNEDELPRHHPLSAEAAGAPVKDGNTPAHAVAS